MLQGRKWYLDLSKREKIERLTVESEPRFNSYFYFKDEENFELKVNEADCKCTLAGTYLIHPVNMESNVQVSMQSLFELFAFEKNEDIPSCVNGVVRFLEQFGLVADYYKSSGTIVFHRSTQETARPTR